MTALLWWLATQRYGWFALGWIALTPLLWSLHGLPARARRRQGHLCGWLSYALINWWIVPTVIRGSPAIGVPAVAGAALGMLAVALIAAIHGFLVALVAGAWDVSHPVVRRARWALPAAAALLWSLFDAARYETQFAHGWGALAYTQWRDTALLQSAALIGQHGLSALCVWFAASLALWMRSGDAWLWRVPVAGFLLLHLAGAWRLRQPPGTRRELRVVLVQTAVPSTRKSSDSGGETPFAQAMRLTRQQVKPGSADLVVWPETTTAVWGMGAGRRASRVGKEGRQLRAIDRLCRDLRVSLLAGAQVWAADGQLHNAAIMIGPDGSEAGSDKQHLVPFGERAPLGELLPWLRRFAPSPEVVPAVSVQPLPLAAAVRGAPLTVGSVICFESCFRYPARRLARQGAAALFVLTNDEWFTGTEAPWEHAAMATVRAAENGVAVAQVANGGYSFVVDPRGRFVVNSSVDPALNAATEAPAGLSAFGKAQALTVRVPLPWAPASGSVGSNP